MNWTTVSRAKTRSKSYLHNSCLFCCCWPVLAIVRCNSYTGQRKRCFSALIVGVCSVQRGARGKWRTVWITSISTPTSRRSSARYFIAIYTLFARPSDSHVYFPSTPPFANEKCLAVFFVLLCHFPLAHKAVIRSGVNSPSHRFRVAIIYIYGILLRARLNDQCAFISFFRIILQSSNLSPFFHWWCSFAAPAWPPMVG